MTDLQQADAIIREYSEANSMVDSGNLFYASLVYKSEIQKREKEIEILRQYGNKDCTALADEELARLDKNGSGT